MTEQELADARRPALQAPVYFTIKQIAERHPALTERTLRHWVHFSVDRVYWHRRRRCVKPGNGFARVIVRKGPRIYIDEAALIAWLREGNGALPGR
jgi:hypothetical protein